MKLGHEGKKIGVCMLFAASCFIAAFVLIEFHDFYIAVAIAGVLLMISAYLLLTIMLSKKTEEWSKPEPEEEETPSNKEAEFRDQIGTCLESIDRTQRAMFAMIKRNLEQHETDISAIESTIERLIAEQASGIKTLVKYNKENARQLAINERDSISELKKGIQDSFGKYTVELKTAFQESIEDLSNKTAILPQTPPQETVAAAEAAVAATEPETIEITEALAEEPTIEEITEETLSEAEELQLEELYPTEFEEPAEEIILPETETPDPIIEEVPSEPEPIEFPAEEPIEPIAEPISDPNAPLSPDDIAKLFAAAEQTETLAEETTPPAPEPVETPASEPAPALDPNAPLSPEDIAKLFASMGN